MSSSSPSKNQVETQLSDTKVEVQSLTFKVANLVGACDEEQRENAKAVKALKETKSGGDARLAGMIAKHEAMIKRIRAEAK